MSRHQTADQIHDKRIANGLFESVAKFKLFGNYSH
jgi:hypothetical protein